MKTASFSMTKMKISLNTLKSTTYIYFIIDLVQKFKGLVDSKLDKFISDFGIPADSFVMACEVASQRVHKSIVNQLLAVENFLVFKKMMIARNK